jgi:tetratricopeptide (TPR) repeat protein
VNAGEVIAGRFELSTVAGAGGMGTVWRARDLQTGRLVALKLLNRQSVGDTERFGREARALSELCHPGTVRYVAHGTSTTGEHYLAMEWLEGETLAERLVRGPLAIAEALLAARLAASALAEAHARGLLHRDVKPGNLFLPGGEISRLKLLDFGLARRVWQDFSLTRTDVIVGTPGYMAPEQARSGGAIDARADVFSLGCVLFECVSGRAPFQGEHLVGVLARILLEDPPRLGDLEPRTPLELESLVARMLAKDPSARPADGAEVVEALSRIEAAQGQAQPVARTPAPAAPPGEAVLSQTEQRVLCMLLLGHAQAAQGPVAADAPTAPMQLGCGMSSLRAAVAPYGARLEVLAEGSMLATIAGSGAATDQAVRAARCALALRGLLPETPVVLVTGRAVMSGKLPIGAVIDQGVRALREARYIRLDETTAGLLDARFDVRRDADGFELCGERDVLESPRTLLGRTTTCVGRDRELAVLEGLYQECVGEPVARAVLVTGPPGAGKSRLRFELWRLLVERGEPVEVLFGQGDALGGGSPLGLIAPALRRAVGIAASDSPLARHEKLRARLALRLAGPPLEQAATFIGELCDAPSPDEPSDALRAARQDPMLMADAMRAAWLTWLEAECAAHPVLVVLEDLQWGDLPSVQFIDAALRALREAPLMVVALARPDVEERFPRLWQERALQEIRLGPLVKRAAERFVRQVLGDELAPQTVARIVDRAEGNAFSLEELCRAVAAGAGEELPETVLGMAQARLDTLSPDARRLLRGASVFGQVFWQGGLQALMGRERKGHIAELLGDLVAREVIQPRAAGAFPSDAEYGFRHALLRDAAYAMLTDGDRVLGHRVAGEWLSRMGAQDAFVLAEHFDRGREPARAATWYRRGAAQALEANDLAAAISRAERGVSCGAVGEALGALRLLQAQALFWLGEYGPAARRAEEASELVPAGGAAWFHALGEAMAAMGQQGLYAQVEAWARATVAAPPAADGAEARGAQLACLCRAAGYLLDGGRLEAADTLLETVIERAGGVERLEPPAAARLHYARAKRKAATADPVSVVHEYQATLSAFEQIGDLRGASESRVNLGFAYTELGDLERAEAALREAFQIAERMGVPYVAEGALHNLGPVLAQRGALGEARTALGRAAEFFRKQGDRRLEGLSLAYLAMIALRAGEPAGAATQARAACEILRAIPPTLAIALAWLSRALLADGRPAEALAPAREAMEIVDRLGGIEEGEALVRLVHAEVMAAAGQQAEAARAIFAARKRLLERAHRIADPAWRKSFLERLPDHARTLALAASWLPETAD